VFESEDGMNRRDFIGRLLASTVGLALAPEDLLWRPEPGVVGLPPVIPGAPLTLEHLTLMMHKAILERIGPGTLVPETARADADMECWPHLLGIDFVAPREVGPAGCERAYIVPAAAAMAEAIRSRGIRTFGELKLPSGIDRTHRVSRDGLSVRGLMAWDPYLGEVVTRFSVIGG
jgi:hypothetical protein